VRADSDNFAILSMQGFVSRWLGSLESAQIPGIVERSIELGSRKFSERTEAKVIYSSAKGICQVLRILVAAK